MRKPHPTDFVISLPDIGDFAFGRRTLGDGIAIRADYLRRVAAAGVDERNGATVMLGDADFELSFFAGLIARYKVLCVACPAGWEDLEKMDITSVGLDKLLELDRLLRDREDSFRSEAPSGSPPSGA